MPPLRPTDFEPPVPMNAENPVEPKKKNTTRKKKEVAKTLPEAGKEGGRNQSLPPLLESLSSSMTTEEEFNALAELLRVGDNDQDIDARSEVNELQMIHMARARIIASHFNIPRLHDFVRHILTLSLSKGRKSRKEFVAAFQAAHMTDNEATAGIIANMTSKLRT